MKTFVVLMLNPNYTGDEGDQDLQVWYGETMEDAWTDHIISENPELSDSALFNKIVKEKITYRDWIHQAIVFDGFYQPRFTDVEDINLNYPLLP